MCQAGIQETPQEKGNVGCGAAPSYQALPLPGKMLEASIKHFQQDSGLFPVTSGRWRGERGGRRCIPG